MSIEYLSIEYLSKRDLAMDDIGVDVRRSNEKYFIGIPLGKRSILHGIQR